MVRHARTLAGAVALAAVAALAAQPATATSRATNRVVFPTEFSLPTGFLPEGIGWIVSRGVTSLVVDLPSLDRGDDPSLAAHRAYWGLPAGGRRAAEASRANALVTELAYVPERMLDGLYLLELQVAPFASDAAPSRPVIRAASEVRG